ncbi:MAG TPA: 2-amino-4-hydroxy-6-hydroxymethyldihydropteridine diphosphokinase [Micromonosporaceae bacterium]|nr:2-amino-4-hydroxy-6-hydroxymethyldihydropteridine diphosphokinase [Micromonosporaceae bacterium]
MTRAVLSLGGNLDDPAGHLRAAVSGLDEWLLAVSGVYETDPWGEPDQPPYLNAAALVHDETATPRDWLERARALELAAGRVRRAGQRFGPRTLDVDVVVVWTDDGEPVRSDDPQLTLPHPRAHLRAFVLRPWVDIQPYAVLPGHGRLTDLLRAEPVASQLAGVRARAELEL